VRHQPGADLPGSSSLGPFPAQVLYSRPHPGIRVAATQTALLTDLYQLNMLAASLDHGLTDTAVFELFVRKLHARRGFLMAPAPERALPRNPAGAG
jgi:hypothetical protein